MNQGYTRGKSRKYGQYLPQPSLTHVRETHHGTVLIKSTRDDTISSLIPADSSQTAIGFRPDDAHLRNEIMSKARRYAADIAKVNKATIIRNRRALHKNSLILNPSDRQIEAKGGVRKRRRDDYSSKGISFTAEASLVSNGNGPTSCLFFNRFGRCRMGDKCVFQHDRSKVAVCRLFLQGNCSTDKCTLSHVINPAKMPTCTHFIGGTCSRTDCPYRHVKVSEDAAPCVDFQQGHCPRRMDCPFIHVYPTPTPKSTPSTKSLKFGACHNQERGLSSILSKKATPTQEEVYAPREAHAPQLQEHTEVGIDGDNHSNTIRGEAAVKLPDENWTDLQFIPIDGGICEDEGEEEVRLNDQDDDYPESVVQVDTRDEEERAAEGEVCEGETSDRRDDTIDLVIDELQDGYASEDTSEDGQEGQRRQLATNRPVESLSLPTNRYVEEEVRPRHLRYVPRFLLKEWGY